MRIRWTDLLLALVRAYQGKRTTMWERIPNVMAAAARQTATLDRWFTLVLRGLQIPDPGAPRMMADRDSSLSGTWHYLRADVRRLPPSIPQAERQALRLLRDEIMTIVAEARLRWDDIKAARTQR